ncbi:acyltransferase family protein [Acinetobacter sp.]|uniref:acyltransferase family protein n=1 Tax=Acinetobacter sp. TaxID=472 RepID=UPI003D047506
MNSNYQRHIDILRALAVLLVIFHHLKIPYFNGGFIGVDIFLVISGYLITKNIKKEKLSTAHFSFKNFYNRRIIRLAPSFFLVILTSMIAFFFILTPEEWSDFLKTAIASIFLTSNIYYSSLLNNYFTINSETTPLLHLWSLSLEEQFYLIWPIFLILLLRLKNHVIFLILSLSIILSIFISHIYVIKDPVAAYYLLAARFFEFIFGALLNFIKPIRIRKNISCSVGITLIACIIMINMIINKDSLFPSYIAALPCFLAALYILLSGGLTQKTTQTIEYIGKISYPMYLWHWPIISYLTILSFSLNITQKILIICLTIMLSIVTHEFIEKKISKIFSQNKRPIIYLFMLPAIPVFLAYLYHLIFFNNENKIIKNDNSTFSIKCIDNSNHPIDSCYFGKKENRTIDILLVGDSHANSQSGMVDILAKQANLKGYEITFSSTAYLVNVDRYSINPKTNEIQKVNQFSDINIFIQDHIKNNHFKYVVMGGFFPHNWNRSIYSEKNRVPLDKLQSKKAFIYGLKQAISSIIKSGARPLLINDNPILVDVDVNCHLRFFNDFDHCTFPRIKHDHDFKEWQTVLVELQKSFPKLIVIDFTDIICDEKKCFSTLQNTSLYRDSQHLTYNGSSILGNIYLRKHSNPFLEGH